MKNKSDKQPAVSAFGGRVEIIGPGADIVARVTLQLAKEGRT